MVKKYKGYIQLNYVEKKILKILSNKRGKKSSTINDQLGQYGNLMHPALTKLNNLGLIQRKQIPLKNPTKTIKTKTQYFITEEGLKKT